MTFKGGTVFKNHVMFLEVFNLDISYCDIPLFNQF